MSPSKLALSFRMFQNGQLVREDTLAQSVIKIGKVPSAHLQIADDAVSRMHAIVEVTGREVSLIDLGSTRGTFVNGKKINKARLESGDVILVGDTRIEFAVRDGDPAAQRPEPRPAAIPQAVRRAVATEGVTISGTIETAAPLPPAAPVAVQPPAVSAPPPVPATPRARVPIAARPPAVPAPAGVLAVTVPVPAPISVVPRPPVAPALPVEVVALPAALHHAVTGSADELGGARSVEVAAMLGDSVVGVKHCIDPRSGRVAPATWGLVAGGAACLLASAIAFTASVHNAAENHARLERWTKLEHRPEYAFRPHRLGPDADWFAFGGFGLALVGVSLGVLRMRKERTSPYYRIGTAPGVELALDSAPAAAFPLVAPSGDDFVFNFAPGIEGELVLDGKATPLAELAAAGRARPSAATAGAIEVPIPSRARIRARAGRTTFLISAMARPRRYTLPLLAGLERRATLYFAGSLTAHLGIWALLRLLPPTAAGLSMDPVGSEPIYTPVRIAAPNDPVPPQAPDRGDDGGAAGTTAMAFPPGTAGNPDSVERGGLAIARSATPPAVARAIEIERARTAGFLGAIAASDFGALSGVPDPTSGFDETSFNGPVFGGHGEGAGMFGGGVSGTDLGGGCATPPCGLYGTGRAYHLGVIGPGDGRYGLHGRTGGYGLPGAHPTVPQMSEPKLSGAGYDRSIIRRYIRRSIDKISYCYDKQLLAHPGIGGEIVETFFIAPTGVVQTSSGSGFDPEVAACVAEVIQTIAFPRTGDGIGVQVKYPFQFHAAGR